MLTRRTVMAVAVSGGSTALAGCTDTITGGDSKIGGLGGSDVEDRRREVVTAYDAAVIDRNDALSARNDGLESFNADEYDDAADRLETAAEGYESAESRFSDATETATQLAEEEAASICERSAEEARLQLAATEAIHSAANAAADGAAASTINGHIEEYRELEAQAETIAVADPDVVAETLGLE